MSEKFKLTTTDKTVIKDWDVGYLVDKGAECYNKEEYAKAVEYYRLAAAMGDTVAVSNLGYCYLYGRSVEQNTDLAIAYFTIAANECDVESLYKLGDIYSKDKWGLEDKELSNYYYKQAVRILTDREWEKGDLIVCEDILQKYPSLAFAMARETFMGGSMPTNIEASYQFLMHAKLGYEKELEDGKTMYQVAYEDALELLENEAYDETKKMLEWYFHEESELPDFDEEDDEDSYSEDGIPF